MRECIVISDGDKLKTIREKYNLKQEEISGKDITRNLISEIETNKANITKRTAEVIIKNLAEVAKKKGFQITETVEYLMENQVEQANKVFDDYIEELKTLVISKDGSFIETLKKAESFLIDWDIKEKKVVVYELAGDYFCNQNDFYKSSIYYEKANALINKRQSAKELLNILRKLSMVYFYVEKYKESIECSEFATIYFSDMDNKNKATFFYNSAICYEKLKDFNKALYNFNEAEKILDKSDENKCFDVSLDKATCLYSLKKYDEALKIFNKILELVNENDVEKYLITLVNMSNMYIKINDNRKVNETLEIILKKIENINITFTYVSDIYFEVGKIFKYLNTLKKAEEFYLKSLEFAKENKNYFLIEDILSSLIDIYKPLNVKEKADDIKKAFFELSVKKEKVSQKILHKLIDFYLNISDIESLKQINNFAFKYIK